MNGSTYYAPTRAQIIQPFIGCIGGVVVDNEQLFLNENTLINAIETKYRIVLADAFISDLRYAIEDLSVSQGMSYSDTTHILMRSVERCSDFRHLSFDVSDSFSDVDSFSFVNSALRDGKYEFITSEAYRKYGRELY
jgi:hypothetical protein